MAPKGFKVIIVGGSVTGLSLANMLEKFDIDYILLEAYPQIAPQVGASLGFIANGLRILDQIGCYEDLKQLYGNDPVRGGPRDIDGQPIGHGSVGLGELVERKLGWGTFFLDRQMLLQVLYKHIQHKERVLPNKRVVRLQHLDSGVEVTTKDGSTFRGDIVVGADGIHSAVREEMWRLAKEDGADCFPPGEASRVSVDTKCIFGISKRPEVWPYHFQANVFGNQSSYLIVPGPEERVYFFLFANIGPTKRGKDIPKYTKEDEALLAEKHSKDPLLDNGATFGDLYKARIISTLVPLEEHVFARWHYRRVITIGDSAHKIDPITGQGGNGALEAAALLINSLNRLLDRYPSGTSATIPESEINAALADVQNRRFKRAETLVQQAHFFQRIVMKQIPFAGPALKLLNKILGVDLVIGRMVSFALPAPHVERLPVPKRTRAVPWNDELPSRPLKETTGFLLVKFVGTCLLGGLAYYSITTPQSELQRSSSTMNTLVTTAAELVPTVAVWIIESYRENNYLSLIRWPMLFFAAATGKNWNTSPATPLYYLATMWTPSNDLYGRIVPTTAARAVIPALSFTYLLPTSLVLLPNGDSQMREYGLTLLSAAPLIATIVGKGITFVSNWLKSRKSPEKTSTLTEKEKRKQILQYTLSKYDKTEVPILNTVYKTTFAVSTALHLGTLTYSLWGRSVPMGTAGLVGLRSAFAPQLSISSASILVHLLYTVWDLRARGYTKSMEAIKSAVGALASQVVLGPGAALAGVWWWRENLLADLAD